MNSQIGGLISNTQIKYNDGISQLRGLNELLEAKLAIRLTLIMIISKSNIYLKLCVHEMVI